MHMTKCTYEDLVYEKHSEELIGFTDLGDINSYLDALEQGLSFRSDDVPPPPATYCIHGARFSKLQFAYALFPYYQEREGISSTILSGKLHVACVYYKHIHVHDNVYE